MRYLMQCLKKYFRLFKKTRDISYPVMILAGMLATRAAEDYTTSVVCILIATAVILVSHVIKAPEEFSSWGDKIFYILFILALTCFVMVVPVNMFREYLNRKLMLLQPQL